MKKRYTPFLHVWGMRKRNFYLRDNTTSLCRAKRLEFCWQLLNILRNNLEQSARNLGLDKDYYMQHDNDAKHTAQVVLTSPQSPDLNSVQNLWEPLERRRIIRQYNITSKEMLRNILREEREKTSSEETEKFINSMPSRLQVIKNSRNY